MYNLYRACFNITEPPETENNRLDAAFLGGGGLHLVVVM
jgi:hypothetical protein